MWNIKTPKEAKKIIAKQTGEFAGITPQNLEEQALQLAGRDVYEKLIKGYTEKQWGRDCKDLPAFIIRRLPLRFTYDNNYFNDRFQGIPEGGYTQIVEKLLEDIPVLTGVSLQEYQTANTARTADEQDSWDRLLYTGMIDEYYHYRLGTLEYRSLRFETEELPEEDNYQGNAVVNYTEREVPYTRIIEHKHFEFQTGEGTVITREYPATWKRVTNRTIRSTMRKTAHSMHSMQSLRKRKQMSCSADAWDSINIMIWIKLSGVHWTW